MDGVSELKRHWTLDSDLIFLNHGSFGACPRAVLEAQRELQDELERNPVNFFLRRGQGLFDASREELARFVGANPDDLAFVPNTTTGVNAVLRSLVLQPGDELLVTDHAYNACANALRFVAERAGAKVVVAHVPFPVAGPGSVLDAVLECVTARTRLALLDHVTSGTGLVMPLETLIRELRDRDVEVLVDGAHAPGMLPLRLSELGAAYYTGNCHKWLCSPKGAGFLVVRRDLRDTVRPAVISHGANAPPSARSRFHLEFDWTGTQDPTAAMVVGHAIRIMAGWVEGGWQEIMDRNHRLVVTGRELLAKRLHCAPPCPDDMLGSLASLPLPDAVPDDLLDEEELSVGCALDPPALQERLFNDYRIEVPVVPWPHAPKRLLRVSAQLYNDRRDFERLADALGELLG